VQPNT